MPRPALPALGSQVSGTGVPPREHTGVQVSPGAWARRGRMERGDCPGGPTEPRDAERLPVGEAAAPGCWEVRKVRRLGDAGSIPQEEDGAGGLGERMGSKGWWVSAHGMGLSG